MEILIRWIVIYSVDSAIYLLVNRDQDCKDASGLKFIKFDAVTSGQRCKIAIFVEF